jgi:signal transduction histidine kinase
VRLRRLSHRIYLSLLLVGVLSITGTAIVTHTLLDQRVESPIAERLVADAEYVAAALPPADAPAPHTRDALRERGRALRLHLLLLSPDGAPLASTFDAMPRVTRLRHPRPSGRAVWIRTSRGHALAVRLPDGRLLAAWPPRFGPTLWPALAVFFGLLAAGCVFIARGLTRRLEALEDGVAQLGAGRLETRVRVEGRDEIAHLAERFNWAAARIERLVDAQRHMLRNTSHEIRSPLARVRLALELLRDSGPSARIDEAVRELHELDALVDDLLLASRMEMREQPVLHEPVDLVALVTEEAARAGARTDVAASAVEGDPRLLRRLLRNLLENAVKHGGTSDVVAGVAPAENAVRLWVADRGPGVPAAERERIFEPFYRAESASPWAGAGLGLALVRQIAEHHGGRVAYREREGGGAVFEVTLPAGRAEATSRP